MAMNSKRRSTSIIREKAFVEEFMRSVDLPDWYRGISSFQLQAANNLLNAIRDDLEQGTSHRVRDVLDTIGLRPAISKAKARFVMKLSRGNDLAFLWFLKDLYYTTEGPGYSLNEQLIFSCIAHLDLIFTIRGLNDILPPEQPPKNTIKPYRTKMHESAAKLKLLKHVNRRPKYKSGRRRISTVKILYHLPYLDNLRMPRPYGKSLTLQPPDHVLHLEFIDVYKDPNYVIPNESSRWFSNYNLNYARQTANSIINENLDTIFKEVIVKIPEKIFDAQIFNRLRLSKIPSMANIALIDEMERNLEHELRVIARDKCRKYFDVETPKKEKRILRLREQIERDVNMHLMEFKKLANKSRSQLLVSKENLHEYPMSDSLSCDTKSHLCSGQDNKYNREPHTRYSLNECGIARKRNNCNDKRKPLNAKSENIIRTPNRREASEMEIIGDCLTSNAFRKPSMEDISPTTQCRFCRCQKTCKSQGDLLCDSSYDYIKNYDYGHSKTTNDNGPFFNAPKKHRPFKFDYNKIFDLTLADEQARESVRRACVGAIKSEEMLGIINSESKENVDAAIKKYAFQTFKNKLKHFKENYGDAAEDLGKEEMNTKLKYYDPDDKELMHRMLQEALERLTKDSRYVLPTLPDAHKVPILRYWVYQRYGKVYTQHELALIFNKSAQLFRAINKMTMNQNLPAIKDLGRAIFIKYNCHDYLMRKSKHVRNLFYKSINNSIMEQSRRLYIAMSPYLCTGRSQSKTIFAYLPARPSDIQHIHLWNSRSPRRRMHSTYIMFSGIALMKPATNVEREKIARNKRIIEKFVKAADVPKWYRGLSPFQLDAASQLHNAIRDDSGQGTTHRVQSLLNRIGIRPTLPKTEIRFVMFLSGGNDLAFLWFINELYYNTESANYSVNEQLLLSSVAHLDFLFTLRGLDSILPPAQPTKAELRRIAIEKQKISKKRLQNQSSFSEDKTVNSMRVRYKLPYFEELVRPRLYEHQLTAFPSSYQTKNPHEDVLKDPNYVIPNESNRWFANYNLHTGVRTGVQILNDKMDQMFKENYPRQSELTRNVFNEHIYKRIRMTEVLSHDYRDDEMQKNICQHHKNLAEMEKNFEHELRVRAREKCLKYFDIETPKREERIARIRKQIEKDVNLHMVQFKKLADRTRSHLELWSQDEIRECVRKSEACLCGGEDPIKTINGSEEYVGACLKKCSGEACVCKLNAAMRKRQHSSTNTSKIGRVRDILHRTSCDCGYSYVRNYDYGHPEQSQDETNAYFKGPGKHQPYKFNYSKVFEFEKQDTRLNVQKEFLKIINSDLNLNKNDLEAPKNLDEAIKQYVKKTFKEGVAAKNEELAKQDTVQLRRYPFLNVELDYYDPDDEKLMQSMLKNALDYLANDPKYVLASMPDAHKLRSLISWVQTRYGKVYTREQLRKEHFDSLATINALEQMTVDVMVPTKKPLGGATFVSYNCRDYLWKKTKMLRKKYYDRLNASIMDQSRTFYMAIKPNICRNPRDTFFAYMPSREADIQQFRIWRPHEYMPAKEEFVKRKCRALKLATNI
ncbi:uncharacterized protein LOC129244371 [Anastrepha obliqua]|uniref:uncharacterized protein LOC129244371 n=1 Tax=Anastrepha obliqua TaxID=95512 RepID=UPI002409FEA6|nr:uncharacterized protein LOC129244371 [Anastrepha obliqua]